MAVVKVKDEAECVSMPKKESRRAQREAMEKKIRGRQLSFEIDPPEEPNKVVGLFINALNWLVADDLQPQDKCEPDPDAVYQVSADPVNSFSALKRIRIEGRDYYSPYSLTYMKTWMLTESHNQIRRRHMQRCKQAFGELDYSGPVWTESDDPDSPEYT